jgi:hypothetical protein
MIDAQDHKAGVARPHRREFARHIGDAQQLALQGGTLGEMV